MEPITNSDELKNAIQILEFDQQIRELELKEQVYLTVESLKPVNLIKSTLHEAASSPYLIDNVLGATVSLASGYVSRKLVVGGSHNIIRKLFGAILQFGVTNVVAQRSDQIKSIAEFIYKRFLRKKEMNSENL
ncbi:MAG TPA: hypothetical protein DEH15_22540 [Marinilabiliales bacterium]|nr:hypothetical protein [Marinilabiliales bacterium]